MSIIASPDRFIPFNRPLTRTRHATLSLINMNDRPIVFRLLITNDKRYVVRPNCGRLQSGKNVDITITHRALRQEPDKAKDFFLIQSFQIPEDELRTTVDRLWRKSASLNIEIQQKRLRARYTVTQHAGATAGESDSPSNSIDESPDDASIPTEQFVPAPTVSVRFNRPRARDMNDNNTPDPVRKCLVQ